MSKLITTAVIGNILEYYDIALYGFLAPQLVGVFFPLQDPAMQTLAGFATFAGGFVLRPVGGILFGHIGDCYGRKRALTLSLLLTAIPTSLIGLLPSYEQIGLIAPLCLIVCRFIQGLSIGGESAGIIVYSLENAPRNRIYFMGSLLCSASFLGTIVGAAVSALCSMEAMPKWGWRIPFWLGGVLAVYGYYLRLKLKESKAFLEEKEPQAKVPFLEILKHGRRNFLCTVGLGAACSAAYHLLVVYSNTVLKGRLPFSFAVILSYNTLLLVFLASLLPLAGRWADKVGAVRLMKASMVGMGILAYPYFWCLENASFNEIAIMQGLFTVVFSGFLGPISAYLIELFKVQTRYSGIGVGYNLGNALFGGPSPLIVAFLAYWLSAQSAPASYLLVACFVGWLSLTLVCPLREYSPLAARGELYEEG